MGGKRQGRVRPECGEDRTPTPPTLRPGEKKGYLQPDDDRRSVPLRERQALSPGLLEQLVPAWDKTLLR